MKDSYLFRFGHFAVAELTTVSPHPLYHEVEKDT